MALPISKNDWAIKLDVDGTYYTVKNADIDILPIEPFPQPLWDTSKQTWVKEDIIKKMSDEMAKEIDTVVWDSLTNISGLEADHKKQLSDWLFSISKDIRDRKVKKEDVKKILGIIANWFSIECSKIEVEETDEFGFINFDKS